VRREPIYGLDLVRFWAASSVLLYHLGYKAFALPAYPIHLQIGGQARIPEWGMATWWGWVGVQIFFVISGLVISYSAEGATWRSFVRSRIARLLPAMVICATLIAAILLALHTLSPAKAALLWVKSVLFFPLGPWLTGQIWTLPVEICFYGAVWLMICAGQTHRLEAMAWALGLISAAYWLAILATDATDTHVRLTQLLLLQHGCYFALGILLSLVDRSGLTPARVALGVLCVISAWLQIAASTISEAPGYGLEAYPIVPFAIWLSVVAAIAGSLFWKSHIASAIGRGGSTLRMVGLITYPLYLIHINVGGPLLVWSLHHGAGGAAAVLVAATSSVVVAWVIARYFEPPAHVLVSTALRRLLRG
jgi:exopolysaccharide production protein ExoZ